MTHMHHRGRGLARRASPCGSFFSASSAYFCSSCRSKSPASRRSCSTMRQRPYRPMHGRWRSASYCLLMAYGRLRPIVKGTWRKTTTRRRLFGPARPRNWCLPAFISAGIGPAILFAARHAALPLRQAGAVGRADRTHRRFGTRLSDRLRPSRIHRRARPAVMRPIWRTPGWSAIDASLPSSAATPLHSSSPTACSAKASTRCAKRRSSRQAFHRVGHVHDHRGKTLGAHGYLEFLLLDDARRPRSSFLASPPIWPAFPPCARGRSGPALPSGAQPPERRRGDRPLSRAAIARACRRCCGESFLDGLRMAAMILAEHHGQSGSSGLLAAKFTLIFASPA